MKYTQPNHWIQGGPDDWELALERMGKSSVAGEKMALLEGLACTRNLTLLTAYLDYSISSECKVRTQDKVGQYFCSSASHFFRGTFTWQLAELQEEAT